MKPVSLYLRVSPTGREEDQSIVVQRTRCLAWVNAFGYQLAHEPFMDEYVSGKDDKNRPGLADAIKFACRTGGILLVYRIDRLARNLHDLIELSEKLQRHKVDLASVTENIDTSTAHGDMFFKLLGLLAEFERRRNSDRTREAMVTQQANGRRQTPVTHVPYGMMVDPDSAPTKRGGLPSLLVVNPAEQEIVKQIRRLRAGGATYIGIAHTLDAEGKLRRNGKKWHPKGVSLIEAIAKRPE